MLKFDTQKRLISCFNPIYGQVFKAPIPNALKTGLLATVLSCCFFSQSLWGQCNPDNTPPTAFCVGPFIVALDGSGQAGIDPDDIDNGSFDGCGAVTLAVSPNFVTCANVGSSVLVTLTVTDMASNTNTCATMVTVQDNLAPVLTCPANTTVSCTLPATGPPTAVDNCDLTPTISAPSDITVSSTGANCFVVARTWTATDDEGNVGSCTQTITVQDTNNPVFTSAPIPSPLNVQCSAFPPAMPPNQTATDGCSMPNIIYSEINGQDPDPSVCGHYQYTFIRVWDAVDNCGNITSRSQVINVNDTTDPTFPGAPTNVNVSASANCLTSVNLVVNADDNCAADQYLTTTYTVFDDQAVIIEQGSGLDASGDFLPGIYTILFSAMDPCGNEGLHAVSLNVEDNVAPTAICVASVIQLSIPPTGTATLLPSQVNNGSYDNCTPTANLLLSLAGGTFDCGDVGGLFPDVVTLTVTDANGNTNTCTASVNVVNNSAPAVFCQPLTVTLSGSGTVSVSAVGHDNGSYDNCDSDGTLGFAYTEINGGAIAPAASYTFNCSNVGTNTVRVRIREFDGGQIPTYTNDGFCDQTVTVIDNTAPIAQCTTRTVYLNQAGMWTLTPADQTAILGSSSDACGFTATFSQTMFTCNDIDDGNPLNGPERQITVTLTDPSGNTATCTPLVIVLDTIQPMITCPDTVSICVDANGIGKVVPDSLINGGIYLSSSDGLSGSGSTQFCVTVSNAITISFDFDYLTNNTHAAYDPFGYTVNGGTFNLLYPNNTGGVLCANVGDNLPYSGTATVSLSAGDVFCFEAQTCDNIFGGSEVWVKNFSETFTGDFGQPNWTATLNNSNGKAFFVDASIACDPINYQIALDSTTWVWVDMDSVFCDTVGAYVDAWVRAIDGNGNISDSCQVKLHVEDKEPPIAACDEVTTSLNGLGQTTVQAIDFEQGSLDNCNGSLTFMISKDGGINFFNSLTFNCSEIGQHEIVFKATDGYGNNGFCVTFVEVQDNLPPVITCPPAATITCDLAGNSPPAAITGFATANDNCDGPVTPVIFNPNDPNGADCTTFTRVWRATDSQGNTSQCNQLITVTDFIAPVLSGVPLNLVVQCTPPAAPNVTATDNCDTNLNFTYVQTDSRFTCGLPPYVNCYTPAQCQYYNYTLTRTWTAVDNCNNVTTATRTVTVQDTQAPVINYTNMVMVGNTPGQCSGFATVNISNAITDCAAFQYLTITYEINNNGVIHNGPNASGTFNVGNHTVVFTVVDPCGNTATHIVSVVVIDNETPTAVCKPGPIPITLNSNGIAAITPATVNNGSNDNCAIASLNVNPSLFDCNTSPNPHPVVLTVTDAAGNFNTCTTTVFITNASAPAIVCPADITVDCGTFDETDPSTSGGSATATTACGVVTTTYNDVTVIGVGDCRVIHRTWSATTAGGTATCLQVITVEDNTDPVLSGIPLNVSADCNTIPAPAAPTATDNCDASPAISFVETNNQDPNPDTCDHYTYEIFRTWTATDDCGNTDTGGHTIFVIDDDAPASSIPAIWVIPTDPDECFATVSENLLDYVTDCAADMWLDITNDALANYGSGNGLENINGVYAPGDYPIEFTVTDPCGNSATYNIILRISDMEAPQAGCLPATTLILDGNGNGVLTPAEIDNGSLDNCGNISLSISPSTFDVSDVGVVNVVLTVTDDAGNTSQCTTPVTVIERGTVSASDVQGGVGQNISIPITVTGFDDICAASFSVHVDDNTVAVVTGVSGFGLPGMSAGDFSIAGNDIAFSWVNGVGVTVPDGTTIFNVDVTLIGGVGSSTSVTIDGSPTSVMFALCDLSVVPTSTIDGSVTVVTSPTNVLLDGTIETENSVPVELAQVTLTGSVNDVDVTGATGTYDFSVPTGSNETITPSKDINDCNGINVIDVLLLQLHILGAPANQLPTPYRRIAADINNDGSINVLDRLELHLIVLAGSPCIGLSNNTSWRFVDAGYVFPNPLDPFSPPYPESASYLNIMSPQTTDFIGIKIGDLDLTANPAMFGGEPVSDGGNGSLLFAIDDQEIKAGNEYRVEFRAKDFFNYAAYQYTLNFDQNVLKFKSVEMGALPQLTAQNFGLANASEGTITSIWYNPEAVTMTDGEVLFTVVFDAIGDAEKLSSLLGVLSNPVISEAFTADLAKKDVYITYNSLTGTHDVQKGKMALYQNRPNPFGTVTTIPFYVPTATHATMTISDVSGKAVKILEGDFSAGNHEFKVSKSDLPTTGVFFYRLETENGIAVKKMILLD